MGMNPTRLISMWPLTANRHRMAWYPIHCIIESGQFFYVKGGSGYLGALTFRDNSFGYCVTPEKWQKINAPNWRL